MKVRFFSVLFILFGCNFLFSFTKEDIKFFEIENGLKIYFLEDSTSPSVRLELCVNAGFTNQTQNDGGLFNLYARLSGGELSNDSVRYVLKTAPSATEKAFIELASKLKPVNPTDIELSSILKTMRAEYSEYNASPAFFINSAIDSKIFPEKPWSRESGVQPNGFLSKKNEEIRSSLTQISDGFYTAANSILYVNGNISENALLTLVKRYFSSFPSRTVLKQKNPAEEKILDLIKNGEFKQNRKFVLFHKDFSDEMTQIVLQYKSLNRDESQALSDVWKTDGFSFKKLLLKQKNLKIMGDEYIDASSALEKNSTRLIVQSLLGSAKVSPVVQAELFLSMSRDEDVFSKKELDSAIKKNRTSFTRLSESSDSIMENFSKFVSFSESSASVIQDFFDTNTRLSEINIDLLKSKILDESPFVFVLVNSNVYQKYAGEFKKAGYEAISQKESAWFNQTAYKPFLNYSEHKAESEKTLFEEILSSANRFISKNLSEISSFTLKNGIPVTVKKSDSSTTAVLSLTISGGELLFTDKVPGLASVLTNSIAVNINRQLDLFASNGAISGFYEVGSRTLSTHSIITVTCLSKELDFVIQAAYTALVYCDISPAVADGVTYDERTQWRLKTGSTEFQLLCEAVRLLYKDTDYPKLYRDTENKPGENLDFTKILEAYPVILDSSRFSLIVSGGLNEIEKIQKTLDSTFALLTGIEQTRSTDLRVPQPDFSKLSSAEKKLSLRHLFLTDISKEEAGPMPAVLIPTKKFLDPILYCMPSPDLASTDIALFDALLIDVASRMEEKLKSKYPDLKVKPLLPNNDLPFARIVVTSVEHVNEIDSAYEESISSLKNHLSAQIQLQSDDVIDLEKNELLARLENNWLMAVLGGAASQDGTALLMQSGEIQKNPKLYLMLYETVSSAKLEDYFLLAESYFDKKAPLKIYSKDSTK